MTEPNYKELSKELYEILKELRDVINLFQVPPVLDFKFDRIDNFLHKYEEATNRGTGRTTILYHKAITEALENPGKSVEFVDHIPHNWDSAKQRCNCCYEGRMTCKYYDCGFCYAPADTKNNSIQGGCFEPEYCATYLMQNKPMMTEKEHLECEIKELELEIKKHNEAIQNLNNIKERRTQKLKDS